MTVDKGNSPGEKLGGTGSGAATWSPCDQLPNVRDVVASSTITVNTVLKGPPRAGEHSPDDWPAGPVHLHRGDAHSGGDLRADRVGPPRLARMTTAGTAGLDEDGIVALPTGVLPDFVSAVAALALAIGPAFVETEGVP